MPTVRYGEVVHTDDVPSSLEEKLKKRKPLDDSSSEGFDQDPKTKPNLTHEPKRSE